MRSTSRLRLPLADIAEYRTIKDVTKVLQTHFSAAKIPLSLPNDSRRMLQNFVDEHDGGLSDDEAARANVELKNFWERFVGESPQKNGAFVGVLRELRQAFVNEADILEWWQLVVKPVISGTGYRKSALDDAQEFLVGVMAYDEDEENARQRAKMSHQICSDLLGIYIARTRGLNEDDQFIAQENAQVAQQVESVLLAFGRKQPKDLFHSLDDLVLMANTRLQALTLLSSFLRQQVPHLYLVVNTPLVEHLLKCLMNDTSTTMLSVALTSLIMLLPHIPGSLQPHLPRLFLVYSRLLCWERFSPLSTAAQKDMVTDDRVDIGDHGDVGIDLSWEKVRPKQDAIEASTPEILTYFTYLYGLYPLCFTSYIRKPRKYLKAIEFPGADDFDLDQSIIRSRTEQFRQVHLLHPNFYNMTIEEELTDPKWPKMDPADVVAECHGLCVHAKPSPASPGPPPTGKLPALPPLPPLNVINSSRSRQVSPVASHASFRSGNSWRDTQTTAASAPANDGDSPILRPHIAHLDDEMSADALHPQSMTSALLSRTSPSVDDFPRPGSRNASRPSDQKQPEPRTNLAYLQREITLLRNELNFERWHKAQYSQHISQIARKNVKDATAEAETLNLINANRALKQQLENIRSAREATLKDSALTRKQANNVEAHMTDRFNKMKKEQETWLADADELRRLRTETKQYRDLLVACEARELNKSHQLEIMKRDLESMQQVQEQLRDAQHRLRDFEDREFEFDRAKHLQEIMQNEKETLQMRLQRAEQERERSRRAAAEKIAQLEARIEEQSDDRSFSPRPGTQRSPNTQGMIQQAIADSEAKLVQLKKAHSRLLEKYTDLELEAQSLKSQLDALQGAGGRSFLRGPDSNESYTFGIQSRYEQDMISGGDSAYDTFSEYNPRSESAYTGVSTSDPTNKRYQPQLRGMPISPPGSEVAMHSAAGLTFRPPVSRQDSLASRSTGPPATYNQTAPLSQSETIKSSNMSAFSKESAGSGGKKEKIQPKSEVRVYGRGKSSLERSSRNRKGRANLV